MKELANSPLELYEKAYRLHYDEGRIPEACRFYKAIIKEFPDSNECGYSVIQLEKILSQNVSERINVGSRWVGVLAVISFIVSACCLATVILVSSTYLKKISARVSSASLMSQALGKISAGKDKEALDLLADAKAATQNRDIAPYLLSADIYLKKQQYTRAMAEYDTLRKLPGGETIAKEEMVKAKAEEENAVRRPAMAEKMIEDTPVVQKTVESAENQRAEPPAAPPVKEIKPKVKKEAATPARPVKPKKALQSRADSVSFF
jgi:tetratricopeptide (TPR) repeat protein